MVRKKKSPYWIRIPEIQEIMQCGRTKAQEYMRKVNEDLERHNLFVPMRGRTSRSWFMKFYNLEEV